MASETASGQLRYILELRGKKIYEPKSTVLFRRGDKASGMFVVLSGKVRLDLGLDLVPAAAMGQVPWWVCLQPLPGKITV